MLINDARTKTTIDNYNDWFEFLDKKYEFSGINWETLHNIEKVENLTDYMDIVMVAHDDDRYHDWDCVTAYHESELEDMCFELMSIVKEETTEYINNMQYNRIEEISIIEELEVQKLPLI